MKTIDEFVNEWCDLAPMEKEMRTDLEALMADRDKRIAELEGAAKKLWEAMNQYNTAAEGYVNGSSSISEAKAAGEIVVKAAKELQELLTKKEG